MDSQNGCCTWLWRHREQANEYYVGLYPDLHFYDYDRMSGWSHGYHLSLIRFLRGYKIVCNYEVWHFPNKKNTLFENYVKTFLQCKQEASGYPENVKLLMTIMRKRA